MFISKTFQILKILIVRIILRKLQNSEKNSKNKTILRIRMLVNTGPDVFSLILLFGQKKFCSFQKSKFLTLVFLEFVFRYFGKVLKTSKVDILGLVL